MAQGARRTPSRVTAGQVLASALLTPLLVTPLLAGLDSAAGGQGVITTLGFIGALVGGMVWSIDSYRRKRNAWRRGLARQGFQRPADLPDGQAQYNRPLSHWWRHEDGLGARIERPGSGAARFALQTPRVPDTLRLFTEGPRGTRSGDPGLDAVLTMDGPPDVLHAVLGRETRKLLVAAARRASFRLEFGELRVHWLQTPRSNSKRGIDEQIEAWTGLARALRLDPEAIPARLAAHAVDREEPTRLREANLEALLDLHRQSGAAGAAVGQLIEQGGTAVVLLGRVIQARAKRLRPAERSRLLEALEAVVRGRLPARGPMPTPAEQLEALWALVELLDPIAERALLSALLPDGDVALPLREEAARQLARRWPADAPLERWLALPPSLALPFARLERTPPEVLLGIVARHPQDAGLAAILELVGERCGPSAMRPLSALRGPAEAAAQRALARLAERFDHAGGGLAVVGDSRAGGLAVAGAEGALGVVPQRLQRAEQPGAETEGAVEGRAERAAEGAPVRRS